MINITSRFRNNEKRIHEAVAGTVPAVIVAGGGRTTVQTQYLQYAEVAAMSIVPGEAIATKAYLIIDEVFPTGATISVTGLGGALFTAIAADAVSLTVSTVVDVLCTTPSDIEVTVNHATATGDITTGVARVIVDTIPYTLKTGSYVDVA